jgi:hypothetical protein
MSRVDDRIVSTHESLEVVHEMVIPGLEVELDESQFSLIIEATAREATVN